MGCCTPHAFRANFSANLPELFGYYRKIVLYIRKEHLFVAGARLQAIVDLYLANPRTFDKKNDDLCAVDSVHKLHPLDYCTAKVTREWLMDACLRQHKFIEDFPFQILNFHASYKHYVEFLFSCSQNPGKVMVPNKLADFMWHSHMQDNYRYQMDTWTMLKRVLDHLDDIPEAQLKQYANYTEYYRKAILSQLAKERESRPSTAGSESSAVPYQFIDYGPFLDAGIARPPLFQEDIVYPPSVKDHLPPKPAVVRKTKYSSNAEYGSYGGHTPSCGGYNAPSGGGGGHCDGGGGHCDGGGGANCGGGGASCGGGGGGCGGGGGGCGGG